MLLIYQEKRHLWMGAQSEDTTVFAVAQQAFHLITACGEALLALSRVETETKAKLLAALSDAPAAFAYDYTATRPKLADDVTRARAAVRVLVRPLNFTKLIIVWVVIVQRGTVRQGAASRLRNQRRQPRNGI
jgi:hypothetical protein